MRVKLITFRYSATIGGFDDSALSEFIRDKEVLSFREHFYSVNDVPHLTCVVSYQDPVISPRDLDPAQLREARDLLQARKQPLPFPPEAKLEPRSDRLNKPLSIPIRSQLVTYGTLVLPSYPSRGASGPPPRSRP